MLGLAWRADIMRRPLCCLTTDCDGVDFDRVEDLLDLDAFGEHLDVPTELRRPPSASAPDWHFAEDRNILKTLHEQATARRARAATLRRLRQQVEARTLPRKPAGASNEKAAEPGAASLPSLGEPALGVEVSALHAYGSVAQVAVTMKRSDGSMAGRIARACDEREADGFSDAGSETSIDDGRALDLASQFPGGVMFR